MRISRTAFLALSLLLWLGSNADAASLTLEWDRSTDSITQGYLVWYGGISGVYSKCIDVGSAISHRVAGLKSGRTYFFTVQAYSKTGKRSGLAPEVAADIHGGDDDGDDDDGDGDGDDDDDDSDGDGDGDGDEEDDDDGRCGGGGGGDDDDDDGGDDDGDGDGDDDGDGDGDDDGDDDGPPSLDTEEVVIYASDVTRRSGSWQHVTDRSAADRTLLRHPNSGFTRPPRALAKPLHYFEATFHALGDIQYRVWVRMRARRDARSNDSVFIQFSDTVTKQGDAVYRIGSTSSIIEELRQCGSCPSDGWGWTRRAYWRKDTGLVRFKKDGVHTIRIQTREDGVDIDQIVISASDHRQRAPGSFKRDRTIVPKPTKGKLPASVAAHGLDAAITTAATGDAATSDRSRSSALTEFDTMAPFEAPSMSPSSVSATMLPEGAIEIAWAPSAATAASYRVEVGAAPGEAAYSTYTMDSGTRFDTTGLAASTYFVRVRAVTDSGLSEPSEEVMVAAAGSASPTALAGFSAGQCADRPRAPRDFSAIAEGSTVRLRWEAGAGPLPTGYVLEVGSAAGVWTAYTVGVTNEMTATAAEGTYLLRLTGHNDCGPSRWGIETTIDVGAPFPHR